MVCKHTIWTRLLQKDHEVSIQITDRPRRLLAQIARPEISYPATIGFLGNYAKSLVMKRLGLGVGVGRRGHGEIHLHELPYGQLGRCSLVIDSDAPVYNRTPRGSSQFYCHESKTSSFESKSMTNISQLSSRLQHRLVLPFVDIYCVFVDDVGGPERVREILTTWQSAGRASTSNVKPWLLLVAGETSSKGEALLKRASNIDLSAVFSGVYIFSLYTYSSTLRSGTERHQPYDRLVTELSLFTNQGYIERENSRLLFSSEHTLRFLDQVANSLPAQQGPFDAIQSTRWYTKVSADLGIHLTNFLGHFTALDRLKEFAIPVIASCLVMDHYRPDMHSFAPEDVFDSLYYLICLSVGSHNVSDHKSSYLLLPSKLTMLVRNEFLNQHKSSILSSIQHQQLACLAAFQDEWKDIKSSKTCFSCLVRRPKFKLPCNHWVCLHCVELFGQFQDDFTYLENCILCGLNSEGFRILKRPKTVTLRVLSIDGGGTRVCVPLVFLQVLQDYVKLPILVQDHFDVIYGTSSGALVACGLSLNGWTVMDCAAALNLLSKFVFHPRLSSFAAFIPIIGVFFQIFMSLIADSKYSSQRLENILRSLFSKQKKMGDVSRATELGITVGMITTSTVNTNTFVITNENDTKPESIGSDYQTLPSNDMPIWQAIRCSTAAPYFFRPEKIKGIGYLQDGGLRYNNPQAIAVQHAKLSSPTGREPSKVVSLGNGFTRSGKRRQSSYKFWIQRVSDAFMAQSSGDSQWRQQFALNKENESRYFRFDVEHNSEPPRLDNIHELERMEQMARTTAESSSELYRLAFALRAELFYFELESVPLLTNGAYECQGWIHCRLIPNCKAIQILMEQLKSEGASFKVDGRVATESITLQSNGRYSQRISFEVRSRMLPFSIMLQEGSSLAHISGSPFTIDWLAETQELDAYFGRDDYTASKKRRRLDEISKPHKRQRQI